MHNGLFTAKLYATQPTPVPERVRYAIKRNHAALQDIQVRNTSREIHSKMCHCPWTKDSFPNIGQTPGDRVSWGRMCAGEPSRRYIRLEEGWLDDIVVFVVLSPERNCLL